MELGLRINRVNKVYRPFYSREENVTLNNFSLGIGRNEKFGLVGCNGGGKTTIFKAITGETYLDSGSIEILDCKIEDNPSAIGKIGYCPEKCTLFNDLTVKETIQFYLSFKKINLNSNQILEDFDLYKYRDTLNINLSGGNKRKLNFCLSMIFFPKVVLLDEPTTGIDASSRRTIWKIIRSIGLKTEFSMLTTLNTMEEAENLCERVGWLSKGNFLCVGTLDELKRTYSEGYKLEISFHTTDRPSGLSVKEIKTKLNSLRAVINLNEYLRTKQDEPDYQQNLFCIKEFLDKIFNCLIEIQFDGFVGGVNYFSLLVSEEFKGKFYSELIGINRQRDLIKILNFDFERLDDIFMKLQQRT